MGRMTFNRRKFLGAAMAGAAGTAAPRAFASVRTAEKPMLFPRAMAALQTHGARIANRDLIGIVDFGMMSAMPRFHLVDIANGRTSTLLVSHGRGSDPANLGRLQNFSNRPGSEASSRGSFLTGPTYHGKHGRSRKLYGLDADNNRAAERAIVIHAASYVSDAMARTQGRIGRSQGCFAVSASDLESVLSRLDTGHLLFAWK
jgi:hypothetical protein